MSQDIQSIDDIDQKYSKSYSDGSFWDKIKSVLKSAGLELIYKALQLYYAMQNPNCPAAVKAGIIAALGYFISPIDIIPDFIPVVGFTDDLGAIGAAIIMANMYIDDNVKRKARAKINDIFGAGTSAKLDDVQPAVKALSASRESIPQPQNGDVLRVNRGLYYHYGVYAADSNHVIHYTGANSPADFNGIVRETSLAEFLNGAETFNICTFPEHPQNLNTYSLDGQKENLYQLWQNIKALKLKDYRLYSGDETVSRARSKLGQGGYNLALNNCEHFAVWCKTGVKDSSQVNHILDIITYFLS